MNSTIPLCPIEKREGLNKVEFKDYFLKTSTPVVLTDMMDNWSARQKWTLDFFKINYGHLKVPVYSSNSSKAGKHYLKADQKIYFHDYINMIQNGATDLRLFLFNIFHHAPELQRDYEYLSIMDGVYKEYPFTFFGGAGSKVAMHYDIDMSHVFLSQFEGRKRVWLFAPEQSRNLYHLPFTVASHIDIDTPNFTHFPALKNVQGYECILYPGETLYIPSGYWHYITYLDAGFSMSQRANDSFRKKAKGAMNIATHFVVDKGMNRLLGKRWQTMKKDMAKRRAEMSNT